MVSVAAKCDGRAREMRVETMTAQSHSAAMTISQDSHALARMVSHGRLFHAASVQEVGDFLRHRRIEDFATHTDRLGVYIEGGRILLRHVSGVSRQFAVRRAFCEKLGNWMNIPARTLMLLDPDVAVHVLNNALRIIGKEVNVRVEDGEALTITSEAYTRLSDRDIIQCAAAFGVVSVSRCDFFSRLQFEERSTLHPVKDDVCGVSLQVVNSESGFMALRTQAFILRYACANGAISTLAMRGESGRVHYRTSDAALKNYLLTSSATLAATAGRLELMLRDAVRRPMMPRPFIAEHLDRYMRAPVSSRLLMDLPEAGRPTQYHLFNHLTHRAKALDMSGRLRLEQFAIHAMRQRVDQEEWNRPAEIA